MDKYVIILKPDMVLLVEANSFGEAIGKVEQEMEFNYIFNVYKVEKIIR